MISRLPVVLLALVLPCTVALGRQVPPDSVGTRVDTVLVPVDPSGAIDSTRAVPSLEDLAGASRQVVDPKTDTGPTPRGALIRGALVPGWGHIYTGRYGRLPFVYGAMGGLIYAVAWLGGEYGTYRRAYQFKAYQDLVDRGTIDSNPRQSFESDYELISSRIGAVSATVLKGQRDTLRRNRDFSVLATGVVWALSVLDAYVGAHMLEFDVSDDLSLRAVPGGAGTGPRAVLTFRTR